MAENIDALIEFMQAIPEGELAEGAASSVLSRLSKCWNLFAGSIEEGTLPKKVLRGESVCWKPPQLTFTLERHGATVNGSSRADLHHWVVDLQKRTAIIELIGKRQLSPMSKRLDVKALAEAVKYRISSREEHPSLAWVSDTEVMLNMNELIPLENRQTTQSRRKRFRLAITECMGDAGWDAFNKGSKLGFQRR